MTAEIRHTKDGVPIFDGSAELFVPFKRAALTYVETLEWKKRALAGPRLQMALEGSAKVAVQHQPPGWISHEKGAEVLLNFLKSHMTAPSLAEAGKSISRFFYNVKRRKGETMAAWVVRHDESLYEARRTLAEAIEEYGPTTSNPRSSGDLPTTSGGRSHRGSPAPSVQQSSHQRSDRGPFGANGLLREDDEEEGQEGIDHQASEHEDGGEWTEPWWQSRDWWSSWQWQEPTGYGRYWSRDTQDHQWNYDVSAKATAEADRFLPDFVVAWMLLQRSGLDGTEKAAIIANLKNQFTTERVKEALKLNWSEEDLKRRDQFRPSALVHDEIEEAYLNEDEALESPPEWFDDDNKQEFAHLNHEIETALQAIQHHRRTLRDAREKQTMMRRNRNFYPPKGDYGRRPPPDNRCYRCGGNHKTALCPQKPDSPPKKESGGGDVHFTFVTEPEATALSSGEAVPHGDILSLQSILEDGKAIIDGGATATVASADALDRIQELNRIKGSGNHLEIFFDQKPSFRFGNNGRTTCLSTAKLDVPMNDQRGSMSVHVHEIPKQPVLLSIAALRKLGAVIDFQEDQCILKHVNPQRVIKLERAASGHQVFPLTDDVYRVSERREKPFVSLLSDHAE